MTISLALSVNCQTFASPSLVWKIEWGSGSHWCDCCLDTCRIQSCVMNKTTELHTGLKLETIGICLSSNGLINQHMVICVCEIWVHRVPVTCNLIAAPAGCSRLRSVVTYNSLRELRSEPFQRLTEPVNWLLDRSSTERELLMPVLTTEDSRNSPEKLLSLKSLQN